MGNKKSNGTNIELENNGNKLLDVVTTTSDQEEEQMTSAHQHQQRHPFGLGNFRTSVIWFFLIMSMLYVLYSSNLRLTNDTPLKCSTSLLSLTNISTKENLLLPSPNTSRSLKPPPPQESQQKLNQTITLPQTISPPQTLIQKVQRYDDTLQLKHIAFGIAASSNLWEQRKKYIKLWWKPNETQGSVWLEKNVRTYQNEGLPDIRISSDTFKFPYTNRQGKRSALRLSRIVSEMLRLGVEDVRWFVMGDDDTIFMVDNLVRVLSKYDHTQFYYVGSSSESHVQNIYFSYSMAYGGGGFAISYPLAKELEKMQDRCIQRYPGLYGSDDRIQACMSELGVPLTKETGFHQYDVYGDLLGLLAAHPITPLLSLHHLDVVDPIFPGMNRVNALQRLFQSVKLDSASIMQQSICYDKKRYWSISVSWGYVVQILRGVVSPRELEMPARTFLNWYRRADYTGYAFNTRPVTKQPCQKPYIFYMSMARYDEARRQTVGYYSRHGSKHPTCRWKMESPEKIDSVVVLKRPDNLRWRKSPRRDCCRILPSNKKSTMYIWVGNCREGEVSEL